MPTLIFRKTILLLYLLLISGLSLWPSSHLPSIHLLPYSDKVVHVCMYAGLTFLLFWTWPLKFTGKKQVLPLITVIVLGIVMEFLQRAMQLGRSFDLLDEIANMTGFFPGWYGWIKCRQLLAKKSKN